jgi:hypothetical protein
MSPPKKAGWFRYVKEAFLFRWNVLIFGAAAAAAAISGHADIALPIVAAGEIAYLAGLTSLPRFQGAIDAKARREERGETERGENPEAKQGARQRLVETLGKLDAEKRNRFLRLRARCVEMQRIGNAVRGETRDSSGASQELRAPALDRMLWTFLRQLLAQQGIENQLRVTDANEIKKNLDSLQTRLSAAQSKQDDRMIRSLTDAIATAELRLENHKKTADNGELLAVDLDRVEQKIQALMEMGISSSPDELSTQVDAIADGMTQTESTIRELQQITGLGEVEATPEILDGDLTEIQK